MIDKETYESKYADLVSKQEQLVEERKKLQETSDNEKDIKNRLKELRARDGLNQSELAKLAGVSRQSISLLERGEYTPSVIIAITIAQVFKEPVENVFSLVEEEE